ncbi:hypothetical protein M9434_001750 [Picochlorum sp. BPE23]|nr:hypothetical protein M9434_001750 [Picochlorum sp. BPE23]
MTISGGRPVKVFFEFRIVDSRAAVVLWSSSVTAPDVSVSIREAIYHQDGVQMDRRHHFFRYWSADHTSIKIMLRKRTGLHICDEAIIMDRMLGDFVSVEGKNRVVRIRSEVVLSTTLDDVESMESPPFSLVDVEWDDDDDDHTHCYDKGEERNTKREKPPGNAFSVLMGAQKAIHRNRSLAEKTALPDKREEKHGKDQLHNALIEYCLVHKIYLNGALKRNQRNAFWRLLLNLLWKFNELGMAESAWKVKPPEDLNLFLGYSWCDTSNRSKRKRPELSQDLLDEMMKLITELQAGQWLAPGRGNEMDGFVDGIQRTLKAEMDDGVIAAKCHRVSE